MPRPKRPPYRCPSCHYETDKRHSMVFHFTELKKPCPKLHMMEDLTDEIKGWVLQNRVYTPPPPPPQPARVTHHTTINNVNNIIAGIDVLEKLQLLMSHKYPTQTLLAFDTKVKEEFKDRAARIEEVVEEEGTDLSQLEHLLKVIDQACNVQRSSFDDFCVAFDTMKRLQISEEGGVWKDFVVEQGVQRIVATVQEVFLNSYEMHLMRTIITNPSHYVKQVFNEKLAAYYKFLGALDLQPFARELRYDSTASGNTTSQSTSRDKLQGFEKTYDKVVGELKLRERKDIKKQVTDIVTSSAKRNVDDLNRSMLEMLRADAAFMDSVKTKYKRKHLAN